VKASLALSADSACPQRTRAGTVLSPGCVRPLANPHMILFKPLFSSCSRTLTLCTRTQGPRTDCHGRLQSRSGKDSRRVAEGERGATAFLFSKRVFGFKRTRCTLGLTSVCERARSSTPRTSRSRAGRRRSDSGRPQPLPVRSRLALPSLRGVRRSGHLTDVLLCSRTYSLRPERRSPHALAALADEAPTDRPRPRAARKTESAQEGP
jgi:hypothetical protein